MEGIIISYFLWFRLKSKEEKIFVYFNFKEFFNGYVGYLENIRLISKHHPKPPKELKLLPHNLHMTMTEFDIHKYTYRAQFLQRGVTKTNSPARKTQK